jgi:alpha-tubulin suppressor-like RCC1 family protein
VAVGGGLSFRQVGVGYSYMCGLTTDYRAYCWGANYIDELGDGTSGNSDLRLTPVPVSGGHQFRQIDAGADHTCGTDYLSKRAYCWGWNDYGQVGDGTTTTRLVPVPMAGSRSFRQVSTGLTHTCGVTTSNVAFCWGSSRFGQIGDSSTAVLRVRLVLVATGH